MLKSRKKNSSKLIKKLTIQSVINKNKTVIKSVKLSNGVTQFKVSSEKYDPIVFNIDTKKNEILAIDKTVLGSVKKSKKRSKSSITKSMINMKLDDSTDLKQLQTQLTKTIKNKKFVNYKYISFVAIAFLFGAALAFGVPNVIDAVSNYNHQAALDTVYAAPAEVNIINAKTQLEYAKCCQ